MKQKLNILVVAINTIDNDRQNLDEAVRYINEQHKKANYRDIIEVIPLFAATVNDIRQNLIDNSISIVVFLGHGTREGSFSFATETNQQHAVSPEALAGLLKLFKNIKCVLMLASYGNKQIEAMHKANIEFVAGANDKISDKSAMEYAGAFVQVIAGGKSLKLAKEAAKNAPEFYGDCKDKFTDFCCNPEIENQQNYLNYIISSINSNEAPIETDKQTERVCSAWDHRLLLIDLKINRDASLILLPADDILHHPEAATFHIAEKLGSDWQAENVKMQAFEPDACELLSGLKEALGASKTSTFEEMCKISQGQKMVIGQKIYVEKLNLDEMKQLLHSYLQELGKISNPNKKLILHIIGIPADIKDKRKWQFFGKILSRNLVWNDTLKKVFSQIQVGSECRLFKPLEKVSPADVDCFLENNNLPTENNPIATEEYFRHVVRDLKKLYTENMNKKYKMEIL